MIDRIRELMEYKGLTSTQFADSVVVPRAVISHILSGRNKPSLEVITKIVAAFPEVNINWILLGEGQMLNGLVSSVAPVAASSATEKIAEGEVCSDAEFSGDVSKVQDLAQISSPLVSKDKQEKSVEQIVIFYSDKTFTAYKP